MVSPRKADVLEDLRTLANGITTGLSTATLTIASQTYTGPELLAFVQQAIDSAVAVNQARATLHDALQANLRWYELNGDTLKAVRDMISAMYRTNETQLATFGLRPRKKRAPLDTDALVSRAAKSRATRAKRGTMGKRQKAAIKGNVTGVTIVPLLADETETTPAETLTES